jgi:hypothetical protein
MKWVTLENAKVDRIACPWLIRCFIDKDAEFPYVSAHEVAAVAERERAIPYDVPGVEVGHVKGRCSFESIMLKYNLMDDRTLAGVAKIVHAADVSADIDTVPEGRGLKAIADLFSLLFGRDDAKKIKLETPLYDALYAWCRRRAEDAHAAGWRPAQSEIHRLRSVCGPVGATGRVPCLGGCA